MVFTKEHLQALPVKTLPFGDFPRDSDLLTISIPMFHSPSGWIGGFNKDKKFDINIFRNIYVKGMAWTAYSIATNTDLCDRGAKIIFHIEDKVFEQCEGLIKEYGIPDDWIRVTNFSDPDNEIEHPRHGKKHYCFADPEIDTEVIALWDADALVYRPPGVEKFAWYDTVAKMKDSIITSFFSDWNGGDKSFADWIRLAADLPELPDTATHEHELTKSRIECYKKVGLPVSHQQNRYGSMILFVPKDSELRSFLAENHEKSYADEALLSMWMNAVGAPFHEFKDVFLPIVKDDEEFATWHSACIAHPQGVKEQVGKYIERLKKGIDGTDRQFVIGSRGEQQSVHIVPLAHNPATPEFSHCAFIQKGRKLDWMCEWTGHQSYFYGNELSEITGELVPVTTEADLIEQFGDYKDQSEGYKWHPDQYIYKMFNLRTEHELRKRFKPGDIICYTFGPGQHKLYNNMQDLKGIHMESGIGYYNPYMKYKVFESPSLMNFNYGIYEQKYQSVKHITDEEEKKKIDWNTHIHHSHMQWQDTVIPNSFYLDEFDFRTEKEDYLFFMGRIMPGKGVEEAMRIAEATGRKLLVAGNGDFEARMGFKPWDCVELLGVLKPDERREYLSRAYALLCLSKYPEPFGGVFAEAMLSGTVPIATRMGAFMDYIDHLVNGILVGGNVLEQGIFAVEEVVPRIDPYQVRAKGLRFINHVVAKQYDEYFNTAKAMWENGGSPYWLMNEKRTELEWTNQHAPIDWSAYNLNEKELMTPVDAKPAQAQAQENQQAA